VFKLVLLLSIVFKLFLEMFIALGTCRKLKYKCCHIKLENSNRRMMKPQCDINKVMIKAK